MRNIAVILAAGQGTRVGGPVPKQFIPMEDGLTVLEHCVRTFEQCASIDEILIVTNAEAVPRVQASVQAQQWRKVTAVVPGGRARWESGWKAIDHLLCRGVSPSETNILLHDAARPFVSEAILQNVCAALVQHEAVTVAVPAVDTMYVVNDGKVADVPDRSTLYRAQTPQAFRLQILQEAYRIALQQDSIRATDDCGIVRQYLPQVPVYLVAGEEQNKKLTYKTDFGTL